MQSKAYLRSVAFLLCAILLLTACVAPQAATAPAAEPTKEAADEAASADVPAGMEALVEAAKAEGTLNVIALPRDWCNYGEVIDSFKAKYGLEVNELNPDAGSGDELEAIRANKDNKGPQAPDVIDIGFSFAETAKSEGLIQPYKVATWDTIPDDVKDPEGYWYGDYYGVLSFMVNTDVIENVPQDWADLLKPEYANSIGLSGDPRTSNQAIQTVHAASLANGGTLDQPEKGLDFFAQLHQSGNLVPVIANNALVARGETPIRIAWDYLALSARDEMAGNPPIEVVIPATGRFGGVYVQAISAYAPNPNAAKLWMEGQLMWLKGYCHPIREPDLRARNVIPQEMLDKLPSVEGAVFATAEQQAAAKTLITEQWDQVVGANIQEGQ